MAFKGVNTDVQIMNAIEYFFPNLEPIKIHSVSFKLIPHHSVNQEELNKCFFRTYTHIEI